MKYFSAIAAFLAVASSCAFADTVAINSQPGTTTYLGQVLASTPLNTVPGTPVVSPTIAAGSNNTPNASGATFALSNGTKWNAALAGSTWVSYDPNSGPTGTENGTTIPYDANGFYFYEQDFTTNGGEWGGTINLQADDTVAVFLNTVSLATQLESFSNIGNDGHCADAPPSCSKSGSFDLGSFDAGFDNNGTNHLIFVVAQTGSDDQGLDFSGTITSTPEPQTLALMGTGLLGVGAAFRRRQQRTK